jgi:hypothetical protein
MPKPEDLIKRLVEKRLQGWEPSERDVRWLRALVDALKVGGVWVAPGTGVVFEKVGDSHLRLQSILTTNIIEAIVMIEQTRKVGERAGVRVDVEKAADYIIALGL